MGAGSLGDLLITMSADTAKWQSDMGRMVSDTQKATSDMAKAFQGVTDTIGKVSSAFATMGALAAGGAMFKSMIEASHEWETGVVKLSKSMGMTAEQASVYSVALKTNGVDSETAMMATAKLTKTISTNEDAFKKHGIAIRDSSGALLPMPQIITNTFGALSKLESGTSRNTAAQELLGRSFLQLSSLAKINQGELDAAAKKARDLGLLVGGDAVEAMKKYNKEMNNMALAGTAFKINVANAVKPALEEMAIWCNKFMSDSAVKETIQFLAHPVDFTMNQASYFPQHSSMYPMVRQPMPARPSEKGEEYDPAKAKAEEAAAAQALADKLAAQAAALQRVNEYTGVYNGLQTERSKLQITESLDLTAAQKKMEELKTKYADLIDLYPEYRAQLQRNLSLDLQNEKVLSDRTDAFKVNNAEMKESIRLMEEMNRDWSLDGLGKGLSIDPLKLPNLGGTIDKKDGSVSGGLPSFSLTGPSQTSGPMGSSTDEVTNKKNNAEAMLEIQKKFDADMQQQQMSAASSALSIMVKASGDSKAAQIAALVVDTAIAVAQIEIATSVAAMKAKALLPGAAGDVAYAETWVMGETNMALVVAAGAMKAVSISGARADGGPVAAGQSYLVGEKGPELFTPGASGSITPNSALGGGLVVNVGGIDARGADQGVEQKIRMGMQQAIEASYQRVKRSMDRGGEMAVASGRTK